MTVQTRQPAGAPTGGQFAASGRTEPAVNLGDGSGDFGLYEAEDAEVTARASVTDAVLERYPTAISWQVGTGRFDDGYFFDETDVHVTYLDGDGRAANTRIDLSRTPAADALREVADEVDLGWLSTMTQPINREGAQP